MHFALIRRGVAALAIAGLTACAGQTMVPSQATQPGSGSNSAARGITAMALQAMPIGADLSPDASSPCNISGFWYFKGTCIVFNMPKKGGTATLKAFKGISATLKFAKSNAGANSPFLIGDGTSDVDITGTFGGSKFPVVGTIPCVDPTTGKSVACGKGFFYTLVANGGSSSVTFSGTPAVNVNASKFPGKTCHVDYLQSSNGGYVYYQLLTASAAGGKISFPPFKVKLTFPPQTFGILGFDCSK